eukprot:GFUD01030904.1.p1 GENE.GFUD01030904.1~~GFUD01030904.1.p1  ORF type:complete len:553 (-),score=150.29 GFUD01030904.1:67-1725(-)
MESLGKQEFSSEVYRDKNTLVEVTVHRKPKAASSNNLTREKGSSDKLIKREYVEKNRSRDNGRKNEENKLGERNVQEVLQELKNIVRVSGTKEVQKFLEDFRDETSLGKQNTNPKALKLASKLDLQNLEEKIHKLENNYQDCRREANKCKQDYREMVKQVDVGNDAIKNLEFQIVDLKNIISRLARNNGELLGIVSEKIDYEELIANLEQKMMALSDHLRQEKSHSSYLEQKLHSAESEVSCLRSHWSHSKGLNESLEVGLCGLDQPWLCSRPSFPLFGEKIFAITNKWGNQEDEDKSDLHENDVIVHSFEGSCAIKEKARLKESPQSRPKQPHHQQVPLSNPPMQVFSAEANSQPSLSLTPPTKMFTRKQPLDSALLPPLKIASFLSIPNLVNPPHLANQQISQLPTPTVQQPSQSNSPSRTPFPPPHRAQSRCSTLANAPSFLEDLTLGPTDTYHPSPLELSETFSQSDGMEKQYIGLHQDSLQLSSNIAQPQSFKIPFDLPLMNETRETYNTSNTSVSEGKFLRGLETSIEVKLEEFSEVSDIEHFVTV